MPHVSTERTEEKKEGQIKREGLNQKRFYSREKKGGERKRKDGGKKESGAYGAVYSPSVGAGLPFLQGPLIEKVIELVTCVCGPKQRAEETNELVICPGK